MYVLDTDLVLFLRVHELVLDLLVLIIILLLLVDFSLDNYTLLLKRIQLCLLPKRVV